MGGYQECDVPGVGVLWRSWGDAAERLLPADGAADLILRNEEAIIAGPSTRAFVATGSEHAATVGLRFLPGTAGRALGVHLSEFRDHQVPAVDAVGAELLRRGVPLLRRVRDADLTPGGTIAQHVSAAAAVFSAPAGSSGWAALAREAAARGGAASEFAGELGYSERQANRRMREHFGYGFATLRRVLRAERAQCLLRAGLSVVDTAARAGYSDQAHLSREFRELVGTTPTGYRAELGDGSDVSDASGSAA